MEIDPMQIINREDILSFTQPNPYERFADGRPRVPDDLIRRMKLVTIEEAWGVMRGQGYNFQFEGNWLNLHPEHTLVGRAVTACFVPQRPDLHAVVEAIGKEKGCVGGQNS